MRAVVQVVSQAKVLVNNKIVDSIGKGLLVYWGAELGDGQSQLAYLAKKIPGLRIFEDDQGKMNRSLEDLHLPILVVSQFTLLGDTRKGKRPSFNQALAPEEGKRLYEDFLGMLNDQGIEVHQGVYQAMMEIHSINLGPRTFLIDSEKKF